MAGEGTRWFESRRLAKLLLVAAWILVAALYLVAQRGTTYGVDEFDWITHAGSNPISTFVDPVNGHLMVIPMLFFRLGLELFGDGQMGFTAIELLVLYSFSAAMYLFARERIGPLPAVGMAVIPLTLGAAWPLLSLSLIGIQWGIAASFGLWAFLAVERARPALDVVGCALLCLSIASFSIALPFLAACAALILMRQTRFRDLWVVVVPVVAYLAWRYWAAGATGTAGAEIENVPWLPGYILDSLAAAVAAIGGKSLPYGPWTSLKLQGFEGDRLIAAIIMTLAIAVAVALAIRLRPRRPRDWGTLLAVLLVPLVLWASQGLLLAEFRRPIESRYLFASALALLMVVAEFFRGIRVTAGLAIAVLALTALSAGLGAVKFREGRGALLPLTEESSAIMTALDIAGEHADPEFTVSDNPEISPQARYVFLPAGPYRETARRFGAPAFSEAELIAKPNPIREAADRALIAAMGIDLEPLTVAGRRCQRHRAAPGEDMVVVALGPGRFGILSSTVRAFSLGRFGDSEAAPISDAEAGRPAALDLPADGSDRRWRLRAEGAAPLTVCAR